MKRVVIGGVPNAARAFEQGTCSKRLLCLAVRNSSTAPATAQSSSHDAKQSRDVSGNESEVKDQKTQMKQSPQKTQAELDEEMRQKMAAIAGDGGEAGVELEDGKPVAMKRGVRENMFRLI
ncbi:MAG: hypothetical protein MMC23_000209 [Stictis urceolatum]|nr:hypothetical protein [Stictis urceolata]